MPKVTFTVPGDPVSWSVHTRSDRSPSKGRLKTYQELIRVAARDAMRGLEPYQGQVDLEMWFYRQVPGTAPKNLDTLMAWTLRHILMRPDLTNLQKAAEDGLSEAAAKGVPKELRGIVFFDDSQVTDIASHKRYSSIPRTEFVIIITEQVEESDA